MVDSDPLAEVSELLADINDWRTFLSSDEMAGADIRKSTRTGRPLGNDRFLDQLEALTGRSLRPRKRGPKPQG